MSSGRAVTALLDSGADAYQNMYDIAIKFPWADGETITTVRCEGFENPEMGTATDDRTYHGVTIQVPKPEQEYERKFSLTFRMDASYNLYGNFVTWLTGVMDISNGGVSNWHPLVGQIKVSALTGAYSAVNLESRLADGKANIKAEDGNTAQWVYDTCWVTHVSQPKFATEDASVIKYTVDFAFYDQAAPYTGGNFAFASVG
jgi:hypothetical protein